MAIEEEPLESSSTLSPTPPTPTSSTSTSARFRLAQPSDFPYPVPGLPHSHPCHKDPSLTRALANKASAESWRLGVGGEGLVVDSVTLQPCSSGYLGNQDRVCVREWEMPVVGEGEGVGVGRWGFVALFDGHFGTETVDYVVSDLPPRIHLALQHKITGSSPPSPLEISSLLEDCILACDTALGASLRDLFPDDMILSGMSDAEVRAVLDESPEEGGERNMAKVLRCMRGAVGVVTLIDPTGRRLWIANLGDCQAVLASRLEGGQWDIKSLANHHSGTNDLEVERIRKEHPGEDDCFIGPMVLGKLLPTRAIGDWDLKFPASFVSRIRRSYDPSITDARTPLRMMDRTKSPPYISARAEVRYEELAAENDNSQRFLILASSGLLTLHGLAEPTDEVRRMWVDSICRTGNKYEMNAALRVLRDALGGADMDKVSMYLFLGMHGRWMPDTSVVVVTL